MSEHPLVDVQTRSTRSFSFPALVPLSEPRELFYQFRLGLESLIHFAINSLDHVIDLRGVRARD